jgi:hypothetical protein
LLIIEKTKKWTGFKIKKLDAITCIFLGFFIVIKAKINFDSYCDYLIKHGKEEYRKEISLRKRAEYKRKKINKKK